MNPSEDPADRLLDSLLREQHRNAPDEALLDGIKTALENATLAGPAVKHQTARAGVRFAIAASLALTAGAAVWWQWIGRNPSAEPMTIAQQSRNLPVNRGTISDRRSSELPSKPPVDLSRVPNSPFTERQEPPQSDTSVESPKGPNELASKSNELPVPSPTPADPALRIAETKIDSTIAANKAEPREQVGDLAKSPQYDYDQEPRPPIESESFAPLASLTPPSTREGGLSDQGGLGGNGIVGTKIKGSASGTGMGFGKGSGLGIGGGGGEGFGRDAAGRFSDKVYPAEVDGTRRAPSDADFSREQYGRLIDQPWKSPWNEALSTFSIDVDAASYTNVRNMISQGRPVPPDAVRIEEFINYFNYRYEGPNGDGPFAVHGTLATCPWKANHLLARVAIKGREMENKARPASNLVFLIDVSGSMQDPKKLPLLKRSMRVLLNQLDERDRLGIVVYAGSEGVVLPPTTLDERGLSKAISALEKLEAGGSTNGGAGLKRAYAMASQHLVEGGTNRVILATDGDFNVGVTGQGELVSLVKAEAAKGVSLTVTGFGTGNLNDAMMDAITNEGNGNYYYIDNDEEARRVFLQKLTGTLVTIAKDVKIQVEFNPGKVKAYRLIGYSNRILRKEDFSDDKVDAGDIGAGHTVTAFYEIVPQGVDAPETGEVDGLRYQRPAGRDVVPSDDWFTLKLRHKHPEGNVSSLTETIVKGEPKAWEDAGNDFRFASAVALCGMKLRQMPEMTDLPWTKIEEIAKPALREDPEEQRATFVEMIRKLGR